MPVCHFEDVIDASLRDAAKQEWVAGKSRTLVEGTDATIVSYGALTLNALAAVELLAAEGISVGLVDARFCKPLDGEMLSRRIVELLS